MKKILILLALVLLIPTKVQGAVVVSNRYSNSYALMVGEDTRIKTDETGTTKWTSKNKKIATVSKKGIVKAVGVGETIITAKVDGKNFEYNINVSRGNNASISRTTITKGDISDTAVYITKSKYNSLSNGYSYEDAVKVIGVSGNLTASENDEANKTLTEVYSWMGEDGVANASVIFVNGKITEKAEMFLD